jgi:hypothetical protein
MAGLAGFLKSIQFAFPQMLLVTVECFQNSSDHKILVGHKNTDRPPHENKKYTHIIVFIWHLIKH